MIKNNQDMVQNYKETIKDSIKNDRDRRDRKQKR